MTCELTVATFNLWGLNEPWAYTEQRREVRGAVPGSPATTRRVPGGAWTRRRPLIAQALADVKADVVGLQEDRQDLAGASDHRNSQSAQLARDLGSDSAFLPGADGPERGKGNAVLSRHPVRRLEAVPLPPGPGEAARFGPSARDGLYAAIDTPCGLVHLFVVHLTTRGGEAQLSEAERLLAQVGRVAERTRVGTNGTAIVVGDFNATPNTPTIRLMAAHFRDAWAAANPGEPGHTMLVHTPRTPDASHMRIDYVFVGPGPEIVRAVLLGTQPDADGFYASDHFGVAATLRWPAGPPAAR
jgi:endonuclease/exonuclease/phosphatase family metal-dependent hydrolase